MSFLVNSMAVPLGYTRHHRCSNTIHTSEGRTTFVSYPDVVPEEYRNVLVLKHNGPPSRMEQAGLPDVVPPNHFLCPCYQDICQDVGQELGSIAASFNAQAQILDKKHQNFKTFFMSNAESIVQCSSLLFLGCLAWKLKNLIG